MALPPRCTVNTESKEYTHFLIPYAAVCIVLYPVGVNVVYVVLLWRNRAAIRLEKDSTVDAKAKAKQIGDVTMISFLHHPYSVNYFWWEAVDSVGAATSCILDFADWSSSRSNRQYATCGIPLSQTRRVLLVGVPALVALPAARLLVALSISIVFLVIQCERKPYETSEHNALAELAGVQITATLIFVAMQSAMSIPRIFGFLCIALNVTLIPMVLYFNARRLMRRKGVLGAFLIQHGVEGTVTKKRAPVVSEFFDPLHFSEYWNSGHRSEYEVFSASLDWVDAALERPVSNDRWAQILFTLEQLPLSCLTNADVRHGKRGVARAPSLLDRVI